MPMVLPCASLPDQRIAIDVGFAPQRAVGFEDALGQRQQHAERVLGDRIGVAARLIDDEHSRRRAGVDVDGIEARAVRGHDQEVRRPPQQVMVDMEMRGDLVARRADLVGMRRRQDGRCDRIGTVVLQPVEPHVGTRFQDFDIDLIGEVIPREHALVVDGHFSGQLSVRETVELGGIGGTAARRGDQGTGLDGSTGQKARARGRDAPRQQPAPPPWQHSGPIWPLSPPRFLRYFSYCMAMGSVAPAKPADHGNGEAC